MALSTRKSGTGGNESSGSLMGVSRVTGRSLSSITTHTVEFPVPWDIVREDTHAFFNPAQPTLLTVPPVFDGAIVDVFARVAVAANQSSTVAGLILEHDGDGGVTRESSGSFVITPNVGNGGIVVQTFIQGVRVSAGDTFEVYQKKMSIYNYVVSHGNQSATDLDNIFSIKAFK